jgi:hypothetical protein
MPERDEKDDMFNYGGLFGCACNIIKHLEGLTVDCPCNDCPLAKKAQIYFKLLKAVVDDDDTYNKISFKIYLKEPYYILNFFLYTLLLSFDEEKAMNNLDDSKDNITDSKYLNECDKLMMINKFKRAIKDTLDERGFEMVGS